MNSAATYIATDRLHALAGRVSLPDYAWGAVLSADIAGFTKLGEVLARLLGHARGAEELVARLNLIYDMLTQEVARYGGSVISFSGDALLCWFAADDGRCALACAQVLHERLLLQDQLPLPSGKTYPLTLKTAIASGVARRFLVGEPSIQLLDVLAGECTAILADVEPLAEPGEIVLDRATADRLAQLIQIRAWRHDPSSARRVAIVERLLTVVPPRPWPELDVAHIDRAQLRPLLMPEVFQRLEEVQGEFLTELRPGVALFVHFSGIDYRADTAPLTLDALVRWVQQLVLHYGGSLLQLTTDAQGGYFYLAFGAPTVHQDDVLRAALLAARLCKPPLELRGAQEIKIGISKGLMCTGAYGGTTRRTYGMLGDEVNVAARLMQHAAPGQVLVTRPVWQSLRSAFQWTEQTPMIVKGKQQPLVTYELLDSAVPQDLAPELGAVGMDIVGRDHELQVFRQALDDLATGQSGLLVVEGDAGIGKSHLLARFRYESRSADLCCIVSAADALEHNTPYYVWRSILIELLGLRDTSELQRHSRVLQALMRAPHLARFPSLLNSLLSLDLPEDSATVHMSSQARMHNIQQLVVALLGWSVQQRPLLLILEDAHWLDSASWALLRCVLAQVAPVLIVLATRPPGQASEVDYCSLLDVQHSRILRLRELDKEQTRLLLMWRLELEHISDDLLALIYARTQGNPLFSEELLRAFIDTGRVKVEARQCQITWSEALTPALDLPDTVQLAITSRIDGLAPSEQLTVKVASVIGRMFRVRTLKEIYPLGEDRILLTSQLARLESLDITLCDHPEPDLRYFFKHGIIQEVAYSLLSFAQRRDLHRVIADWYERNYEDDLAPFYPTLAYHWGKAEEPDPTLRYLELSGEQAIRDGAYREAADCFLQALRLVGTAGDRLASFPTPVQRARWERLLGEAQYGVGDQEASRATYEQALARLGWPVPARQSRLLLSLVAQGLRQLVYRVLAPPRPATGAAREALLEAARVYERLGPLYYLANQTLPVIYASVRGLNLAEAAGPSPELARLAANMCLAVGLVPLHGLARTYDRLARRVMGQRHDLSAQAWVLMVTGVYYTGVGAWLRAEQAFEQGLAISTKLGDFVTTELGLCCLPWISHYRGQLRHAAKQWAELGVRLKRLESAQLRINSLDGQAYNLLYLGRVEEAVALAGLSITLKTAAVELDRLTRILSLALQVRLEVRHDRLSKACELSRDLLHLLAEEVHPSSFLALEGYAAAAEAFLATWAVNPQQEPNAFVTLKEQAQQALKGLARCAKIFPIAGPRALLMQGCYSWLIGQSGRARANWHGAIALAQRYEMPYEEALARVQLGFHGDDPALRQTQLRRAAAIFEALEVSGDPVSFPCAGRLT